MHLRTCFSVSPAFFFFLLSPARSFVLLGPNLKVLRPSFHLDLSMEAAKTSVSPAAAGILKEARESDPDILASPHPFTRHSVEYCDGETALHGVAVWQDISNKDRSAPIQRPGILVVHTAVGLEEDFMEWKLHAFAALGFVAFGVDMFGQGQALWKREDSLAARAPLTSDRSNMVRRMLAAYEACRSLDVVDASAVAAAGFCFGGMAVLDLARSQMAPALKATISFHGILDSPDLPVPQGVQKGVNGKILVCHGNSDPFIPPEKFDAFSADMKERGADIRFQRFPGVLHSFTRPEKASVADRESGLLYDEAAAREAWAAAKALLQSSF